MSDRLGEATKREETETKDMDALETIGRTPLQWKVFGLLFTGLAFYAVLYGIDLPLFPAPVGAQLGITTNPMYPALLLPFAPVFLGLGIYAGFVFHKLFETEDEIA